MAITKNFILLISFILLNLIYNSASKKAICVLIPINNSTIYGNVTFYQNNPNSNLSVNFGIQNIQGIHGFHIHQFGNISENCLSAGGHYNPTHTTHGNLHNHIRHLGDFGNLIAKENQILDTLKLDNISLFGKFSIINKTCVIHSKEDDLGKGKNGESLLNGNSGKRIGCGILYEIKQNSKSFFNKKNKSNLFH